MLKSPRKEKEETNNPTYRIIFQKTDEMRYIGHLDLHRAFNRAILRARLPIAYSQGFNPHQLLGFALPLSLGYAGMKEIAEIELTRPLLPERLLSRLNAALPKGLLSTHARVLVEGEKKAASTVRGATYTVTLFNTKFKPDLLDSAITDLLARDSIIIERTRDGKTTETDIRKGIHEVVNLSTTTRVALGMKLAAGSNGSVKPEAVLEALNLGIDTIDCGYVRNGLIL